MTNFRIDTYNDFLPGDPDRDIPKDVLFLDIDGVLNNYWMERDLGHCFRYDSTNVDALNNLLRRHGSLCIVISSTWRLYFSLENFPHLLSVGGVDYDLIRIIGMTPTGKIAPQFRGDEILSWLKHTNYPVRQFVVVDDLPISNPGLLPNFVKTDPEVGLTLKDVDRIMALFGEPSCET